MRKQAALRKLPLSKPPADRWQVGFSKLSIKIHDAEGGSSDTSLLMIVEGGTGMVLSHRLLGSESELESQMVREMILEAAQSPPAGKPRRPRTLQTNRVDLFNLLAEAADELGAEVVSVIDLPELSYCVATFEEFLASAMPLHLDIQGSDPQTIHEFFDAAALFHRSAPWEGLSDEEPITVRAPDGSTTYAVVMGQGGIACGLALYDEYDELSLLYETEDVDPTELACTCLLFVDREEMPDEVWEEIEENDWPVESLQAVPTITRTDELGPPRLPNLEQFKRLTSVIRLISVLKESIPPKMVFTDGVMLKLALTSKEGNSEMWTLLGGIEPVEEFDLILASTLNPRSGVRRLV